MGPLGVPEMIFIFLLALLILGPKKLPEIGRTLGKGMAEFRRASNELRSTFEREMSTLEQEDQSLRATTKSIAGDTPLAAATSNVYGDAAYPYYDETTSSASATPAADLHPVPENGADPHPVQAAEAAPAPVKDSGVHT
jgi:TatA/E family protein of Tat protein translocase